MFKEKIIKVLEKVSGVKDINLDVPENGGFGDYTANIALTIFASEKRKAKSEKYKNPKDLANSIVEKLRQDKELSEVAEKIEVAGPGFINFWLAGTVLESEPQRILEEKENYGKSSLFKGKKMMVEYAHPNTHKHFHIGHLRNISTGETIARILEANGAKVIRVNYQGDVGLHIAKALWGIRKLGFPENDENLNLEEKIALLGKAYAYGAGKYEDDEVAKKEIVEINKKIYLKDPGINALWQKTKNWSLEYFDTIYKRVGTKFDRLYFESEVFESGKKISEKLQEQGILEKSEGAVVFKGEKYGLDTRVFLTKENLPTYEAKELGLAKLEFTEFGEIDKLIHVVAPEQTSFFNVTFKVEELMDPKMFKGKQFHLKYGYVQLKSGKMSSRKGDVVTGEWLLSEAKSRIKNIFLKGNKYNKHEIENISEMAGVAAVKYSMLLPGIDKEIKFDINESIALEGNSGPYLLYTYARAQSVLQKVKNLKIDKFINSLEINDEEAKLIRSYIHFPEVIEDAAKNYSPNLICNYLYEVAQKYNAFYNSNKIINSENEKFRLALTSATGQILKNGLNLLGIQAPEKM